MTASARAAVAYIAGRLATGRNASSVYDYGRGRHVSMSGAVSLDHVNIYQAGAHISGKLPSLYHYGNGAHIQLKISGTNFSGYDYGAGNHFSGRVSGNSISVYDYGEGGYFNYSI